MQRLDISNPFSDASVYYRDVTGSTMDDSKKDSSKGILHGTVYQAGFQKKGRGRIKGRKWVSDAGLNLTFTLILKRSDLKHELNLMPLLMGTGLTSALTQMTGKEFKLKWPNDVLYNGRKTAGILCEANSEYFFCGIGVNCNQVEFPEDLADKAVSLKKLTGLSIEHSSLLKIILKEIHLYINSGDMWRENLEKQLYKSGEFVEVYEGRADASTVIKGEILGIGEDGQLLLRQLNGIISEIYAGEIEL